MASMASDTESAAAGCTKCRNSPQQPSPPAPFRGTCPDMPGHLPKEDMHCAPERVWVGSPSEDLCRKGGRDLTSRQDHGIEKNTRPGRTKAGRRLANPKCIQQQEMKDGRHLYTTRNWRATRGRCGARQLKNQAAAAALP